MTPGKSAVKAGALVVIIFIVGFFTGIGTVATFLYFKNPPLPPPEMEGPPPFADPAARMNRMAEKLGLDAGQRERIEDIIRQTRDRLHDLRAEHRPEIRKILEDSRQAIRIQLDEGQKKTFDSMVETTKERFKSMRSAFDKKGGTFPPGKNARRSGMRPPGKRFQAFLDEASERLRLDADKQDRLEAALQDYFRGQRNLAGRMRSADPDEKMELGDAMRERRDTLRRQLQEFLSDKQIETLREMMDEGRAKLRSFKGRRGRPGQEQ